MHVAILGYGDEGKAGYKYWSRLGAEVTILDQRQITNCPKDTEIVTGKDVLKDIQGFDLLIRSPSINPSTIHTDCKIWSATNEFFKVCPAPIIGVTGTKGKGTTCTLIASMLKGAGVKVHLVGNIGKPALNELHKIRKEDIVVFELSSFQLWDLERSPQTVVVLMVEPDHLDIHSSIQEYVKAKSQIALHQDEEDLLIHHPQNLKSLRISKESKAHKVAYFSKSLNSAHVEANQIKINNINICKVNDVGLVGPHNLENICAAITASWKYTHDIGAIRKAVTSFKGLPHRLELVREVKKVKFYNDSFSSNPESTIAAIKSFPKSNLTLICGGYDRGISIKKLTRSIKESANVKRVIAIGQTGQTLTENLKNNKEVTFCKNLGESIQLAYKSSAVNETVLLSPGFASFDMFKDFKDRGEQFRSIVKNLS